MIGDSQALLSEQFSTPAGKMIAKSPSLSSATTDEDYNTVTGSPKQRWADLSEEDDDIDSELNRFGDNFFQIEQMGAAHDSVPDCSGNIGFAGCGHQTQSGQATAFTGNDAQSDLGRSREHTHSDAPKPFDVLPPSYVAAAADTYGRQAIAPASSVLTTVFTVILSGIPPKLCTDANLDAILWASGVQRSALGHQAKQNGDVEINFASRDAAMHCQNHFKSCSWTTGKLRVEILNPKSDRSDGNRRRKYPYKGRASEHAHQSKYTTSMQRRM